MTQSESLEFVSEKRVDVKDGDDDGRNHIHSVWQNVVEGVVFVQVLGHDGELGSRNSLRTVHFPSIQQAP